MTRKPIVRAREHHGTNSLNLTVPTRICETFQIQAGDMFEITASEVSGQLSLTYKRVYRVHD